MFIMEEKRVEPRVGVSFPVECTVLPNRRKIFYTVSKDLSSGGVRVVHEEFLAKGKDLKVNINLIDDIAEVKAKVMWCNKTAHADRYYLGLKFMEINDSNKRALRYFINKINND